MKTQIEVLRQAAKAIKALDGVGFHNMSAEDNILLRQARKNCYQVLFNSGYDLGEKSGNYRITKQGK